MTVVFTSRNVVLPGSDNPQPATIITDTRTGKITDIQEGYLSRADWPGIQDATWIDAGNNYILPGLVEYV
jgi:allantoinase